MTRMYKRTTRPVKGVDTLNKNSLVIAALLLALSFSAEAQESQTEVEQDAVRRAVETYLYAEEPEERKSVIHPGTKIYSVDQSGSKVKETPISTPARKLPKGATSGRVVSRQKVVSIDVTRGGATVKVETDLSSDEAQYPKHTQYISLLKVSGEWKIVSILMPAVGERR